MSLGADITAAALDAGLLLSRHDDQIHVESPLGRPLPDDLRLRLLEHKQEVLAWLDYCTAADELLLASFARLGERSAALAAEQRDIAEAKLQAAHRSGDIELFRAALEAYERTNLGAERSSQRRENEE